MKTYTELADLMVSIYDKIEHGKIRGAIADLEAIQLDAFKAGAEWAAKICFDVQAERMIDKHKIDGALDCQLSIEQKLSNLKEIPK